ncbi:expressed unknown protein [Seminavis robusta]|uniref:Uncharacterized protein n=1 Tax=Seminavis robusta TaxID=568900 RepID=A0A9N8E6D8_9STRA|nr:expressed unknown protein [Seminavis robusta]|eukprot:Sro545_g163790.1 n/a (301) ;mRNA; f:8169-9579
MPSASDHASKVLIFDWDDTICPSTFVDSYQIEHISELPLDVQELFHEVARCAEKCMKEAEKYGEVIVITNSDEGWVKYSAERFVPRLLPILENYKVISARTRYERFYPQSSLCWKAAAFAHEVNELFEMKGAYSDSASDKSYDSLELTDVSTASEESLAHSKHAGFSWRRPSRREIVSFGDGMEERTAVRIVAEQLTAIPKSVMFLHNPTPIQIIGQLIMLTNHMKYVCRHETSLDLEISSDQAESCAERYFKRHNIHFDTEYIGATPSGGHLVVDRIPVDTTTADSEQHANGVAVSVSL